MTPKIHYLKSLELLKHLDQHKETSFFAVIDNKVKNHLPQWIQFSPRIYWLSNPELQKNLETYQKIVDFFLEQGIERNSVIYAIGGGATSDLAGFVASTLLRGVKWRVIPTTLLAMVDAAIGGKVAVNLPQGKNLVGAFYHPEEILLCTDFLKTSSASDLMSGEGEIIKYGFLSAEVNDLIHGKKPLEEIVEACAHYKMDIVKKDFKEQGDRIFLNLGHTFGHAFELQWKIPHGQAILMGMKAVFMLFDLKASLTELSQLMKDRQVNESFVDWSKFGPIKMEDFLKTVYADKKKQQAKLRFILIKRVGSCYTEELTSSELKKMLEANEDLQHLFGNN
ncbi:MAG: 3-dehydroquinate synthase [Bacteriovoracaceae bacterium]